MKNPSFPFTLLAVLAAASPVLVEPVSAQAPTGPITPQAGTPVQQAPPQTKIVTRVALVNTPVTVRDSNGQMVNTLDAKDFQVTDNGVPQQISHFDLGGDPLSIVFLVETSSRIAPLLPQIQKAGIVLGETVMGPDGETEEGGNNKEAEKMEDMRKKLVELQKKRTKQKTVSNLSKSNETK